MLAWLAGLDQAYGLAGLFASGLLSATVLPGNSELALLLWLKAQPHSWLPALLVITAGNTLGSLSSYALGRLAARRAAGMPAAMRAQRAGQLLRQYGHYCLLLAWLPLIGDALCLAAGWLAIPAGRATALIATGKALRYLLLSLPLIA